MATKTKKKKYTNAQNLERIANALEEFSKAQVDLIENPADFANRMRDSFNAIAVSMPVLEDGSRPALPEGVSEVTYHMSLTDEDRDLLVKKAMDTIEPEFKRMRTFISDALKELPEPTLKKIGEHIARGEVPKFRRRRGCVHLDFGYGDEEFYLKL